MPNWAFGNVKVTGTREGVKSFVERFISSDDQSTVPGKRFFARSFSEQKREQSIKDAMEEFEGKADNERLYDFPREADDCRLAPYRQAGWHAVHRH